MVVVNALVYYSEEDGCFVASGYEISQLGTGKTREKAEREYLEAVRSIVELAREKKDIRILDAEHANPECSKGLTKIILNGNIKPKIEKVKGTNIEIHFYDGGKIEN